MHSLCKSMHACVDACKRSYKQSFCPSVRQSGYWADHPGTIIIYHVLHNVDDINHAEIIFTSKTN